MSNHTLTEKLALNILANEGIEAIWRLHVAAAEAYRDGSCPRTWCKSGDGFALSGGVCRYCQAATAGNLTIGSSLNGAIVSSVM